MTYRSPLKSTSSVRSIQSAIGGHPMSGIPNETVEQVVAEDTGQITLLQAQIASLQSQLSAAQAALAQAQSALAAAQAQIAADAVTIANLQSQVTSLQAQVTALQNQLAAYLKYQTYFAGQVTLVGGGIYVPPAYNNPVILVSNAIIPPRITRQVTTVGGGYP